MVSQSSINNTIQDNDFSVNRATPGTEVKSSAIHSDNTNTASNAKILAEVAPSGGGMEGGDPHVNFSVSATQDYSMGIDNSDIDHLKITKGVNPSTGGVYATFDQATTNTWLDGVSFDGGTNVLSTFEAITSFQPTLQFGGASVGVSYSRREGQIVRIGNIAFVYVDIALTNKGSSTGTADIAGLPFTVSANIPCPAAMRWNFINLTMNYTFVAAIFLNTTTTVQLSEAGDDVISQIITDTQFSNTSRIVLTGFYFI